VRRRPASPSRARARRKNIRTNTLIWLDSGCGKQRRPGRRRRYGFRRPPAHRAGRRGVGRNSLTAGNFWRFSREFGGALGADRRRRTHAGEVDAEPLAGIRFTGGWRQDEPQHRQPQIVLALDQRSQGAGPRLLQQQPERAPPRVADAGRPALRIAGMPLGKAALRVPCARTRARQNRIRTKRLKFLDSTLQKQAGTGELQVVVGIRHRRGSRAGRAICS
jgi:hypothetical protein